MIDFTIPLAGLDRATSSLDRTASRVAKVGFPEGDSVNLSEEIVNLLLAKRSFEANTHVIQAEDHLTRGLLNIVA